MPLTTKNAMAGPGWKIFELGGMLDTCSVPEYTAVLVGSVGRVELKVALPKVDTVRRKARSDDHHLAVLMLVMLLDRSDSTAHIKRSTTIRDLSDVQLCRPGLVVPKRYHCSRRYSVLV